MTEILHSRAGRFGTKGLAITFVANDADQEVLTAIQSRFEVAITELPNHIDPTTYSKSGRSPILAVPNQNPFSDLLIESLVLVSSSPSVVQSHTSSSIMKNRSEIAPKLDVNYESSM